MNWIIENGSLVIWIIAGIGSLFLLNIPQNIYYHFKLSAKPVPHKEVELVEKDSEKHEMSDISKQ